jgi:hypothetical protein
MSDPSTPGETELAVSYSRHLGPRYERAGLRIQFHYNQIPGIHFKVNVSDEYRPAIERGISDGLKRRFPDFPGTASVWITEVIEHEVDSSRSSFYRVAVAAIEQAYALMTTQYPTRE